MVDLGPKLVCTYMYVGFCTSYSCYYTVNIRMLFVTQVKFKTRIIPEAISTPSPQSTMNLRTAAPTTIKDRITALNTKTTEQQSTVHSGSKQMISHQKHIQSKTLTPETEQTNELQMVFNNRSSKKTYTADEFEDYVQQKILKQRSKREKLHQTYIPEQLTCYIKKQENEVSMPKTISASPTQTTMDLHTATPTIAKDRITALNTKSAEEQSTVYSSSKQIVSHQKHARSKTPMTVLHTEQRDELPTVFNKQSSNEIDTAEFKVRMYIYICTTESISYIFL